MDISFIILNYKQKGLVKQCIKGIRQSHIQLSHEIIVVDNNSQDSCEAMILENFPEVKIILLDKNLGFAGGNNRGIQKACGKYIVIINPDVAMVENAIEEIIKFFDKNPRIGIIGPKLVHPDGTIQYSCRKFPHFLIPLYRRTFFGRFSFATRALNDYMMKSWDHRESRAVDWLFGAMLVIRNEALQKVGIFDERFFLYYEDLDICRRFWENGFEVWYKADICLVHYHQRLSAQKFGFLSLFDRATQIHIMSAIKYFAKYLGASLPKNT